MAWLLLSGGLALRWPFVKADAKGAVQVIEPVVQIVSAPNPDSSIPNEVNMFIAIAPKVRILVLCLMKF